MAMPDPRRPAPPPPPPASASSFSDLEPLGFAAVGRQVGAGQGRRSVDTQRLDNEDLYQTLGHAVTLDPETEAERQARDPITYTRTGASVASVASRPPDFEVAFGDADPENPKHWPLWYRSWCIFVVSFATWVATMYSTSYTSSTPGLIAEFGSTTTIVTLGMTTYLLGLAAGSLVVAPMSEIYGRRIVYLICLAVWAVLIIPCGLAQSLTTIIVTRFFG